MLWPCAAGDGAPIARVNVDKRAEAKEVARQLGYIGHG